jgi:hypothetical protein
MSLLSLLMREAVAGRRPDIHSPPGGGAA